MERGGPVSSAFEHARTQQRAAADPAASVFVTANAGSGKTKVLIDRVARLLLAGGAPAAFLCITYTKAAAAEMQRRLFARLGAWCVAGDDALRQELEALGESDCTSPKALARARALFARALETPGGLRIQTIHAFCERLIGRFPLEAGIAPGFEIADEAVQQRLLRQAWARAAQRPECEAALARLSSRLDSERFQSILAALIAKRAKLGDGGEAGAMAIAQRHGNPPTPEALQAQALSGAPWPALAQAQDLLLADGKRNQEASGRIAAARAAPTQFEPYQAIFLKESDGDPHKASPTEGMRKRHAWLGQLFDGETTRLLEITQRLNARARMDDSQAALLLGQAMAGAYAAAKHRASVLDFDDLIESALGLLADGPAAAWVLYKLDGGIDHILIDEGQDTSPSQWALLAPLREEFFAGESARGTAQRTVFAVGDPKQSIYSFQGADPAGFLAQAQALSAQAYAAEKPFIAPTLAMSFRSCPQVLTLVDAVFADQPLGGDLPGSLDRVSHTAWRAQHTGLVQLWPAAPRPENAAPRAWEAPLDQEQEDAAPAVLGRAIAQAVQAWIEARDGVWENGALRPVHAGDVLILVKKRGPVFQAVLRALKRAGLPVAGADRISLREELAVQDLLACMRVALDGNDDLALACVLKGPLVGLVDDDHEVFTLAHGRAKSESLLERLRAAKEPRWQEAAAFVEGLIAHRGANPFDFLVRLLETADARGRSGWQRMMARLGEEARDPLEELLAKALAAPALGQSHLWAFLTATSADAGTIKREGEETGRAVRVMTVHGAKGLEAPVVFLADSAAPAESGPHENLFWDQAGPILAAAANKDDLATELSRQSRKDAQAAEHLRLLYVALTRAQDRLIVCGAARGAGAGSVDPTSWHALVQRAIERIGQPVETPLGGGYQLGERLAAPASHDPSVQAPAPAPAWLLCPAPPSRAAPLRAARTGPALPASATGVQRFARGKLIHGLLQRLPDIAPARRASVGESWLARQGCLGEPALALLQEALDVLAHPDCAPAFGRGSRAEQPVIGAHVRGIIDRVLIAPEQIWVVDFKTDRPAPQRLEQVDARYLAQLAAYQRALGQAFPKRGIRAALIWTEEPRVMPVPELLSGQ